MPVGFIRRFTQDPGIAVLSAIEGVAVIDNAAPSSVAGGLTGVACCVGEFEDGPFAGSPTPVPGALAGPIEVASSQDLLSTFGGFGFTYAGVVASNPCARARHADAAVNPEFWNGNGNIQTANKTFQRLVIARVDTSVGSVQFSGLAAILGGTQFDTTLSPGQVVQLSVNGGGPSSATFTAAPGTTTSAAGVYPSTFAGGETITFAIDGTTYTATFQASDQTQNQVIARMNAAAGGTPFTNAGGGTTTLTGRISGTSGSVQIVAVSSGLVTTATGFTPGGSHAGTGNVANIAHVTDTEANTVISGAIAGVTVDRDAGGHIRLNNTGTPLTGTLSVSAGTTALGFGFVVGASSNAANQAAGIIPAGTQVKTGGGTVFVTMQTVQVAAGNPGPYSVKVRFGLDDGSGVGVATAAVTTIVNAIAAGAFSVTNPLPIASALSEGAIDSLYAATFDSTLSTNGVTQQINQIFSARQSNAVRNKGRQNAIDASANGCAGRQFFASPPLGTSRVTAESTTSQPGVGAYRSERTVYCYPAGATLIPDMATRGLAGGAGFTVDGIVDVHYDSWVASTCSQVAPEENPGEQTPFQAGITSVERNNPDVQPPALSIGDYEIFKSLGIAALRINGSDVFTQSGVTSVDPTANPNQATINRRRFADYCQDTLAPVAMAYAKKVQTPKRKAALFGATDSFFQGLVEDERLDSYSINAKAGNTPATKAANIFVLRIKAVMLPTFDVIVLDMQVGTTVVITPVG